MAQTIETSTYISIKIPLTRGNEETVRTINLPSPKADMTAIQTGFNNIIAEYTGSGYVGTIDFLFQPTNWRDTDVAEEAWKCADLTKITFEVVETVRTSGAYEPT